MKKKLFIFSNEKINILDGKFYCDNIDLKTTPEGLNKKFDVSLFGRRSKINSFSSDGKIDYYYKNY